MCEVLVDEASQATEFASIVPLCRGTKSIADWDRDMLESWCKMVPDIREVVLGLIDVEGSDQGLI